MSVFEIGEFFIDFSSSEFKYLINMAFKLRRALWNLLLNLFFRNHGWSGHLITDQILCSWILRFLSFFHLLPFFSDCCLQFSFSFKMSEIHSVHSLSETEATESKCTIFPFLHKRVWDNQLLRTHPCFSWLSPLCRHRVGTHDTANCATPRSSCCSAGSRWAADWPWVAGRSTCQCPVSAAV